MNVPFVLPWLRAWFDLCNTGRDCQKPELIKPFRAASPRVDLQQGGSPVFPRRCGFCLGEAGLKSQPLSSEVLLVLVGTQPGCGFVCNHRASPQRMHWVFCFLLWAGAGLGVLCASEGAGEAVPGLDGDGNGVPALGQGRYNQQSLGNLLVRCQEG